MRVLITGGSGFVGNMLVRRLVADGHSVHLILRERFRSWRMTDLRQRVKIHTGDLRDSMFVSEVVTGIEPEWVFSSAAYGAYSSELDVACMMETNVAGLNSLLGATAALGRVVFINVASCFEYGETEMPPSEVDRCAPSTTYGISRLAGTALCKYWAEQTELRVATLRLYSTYGPYEDPRRLIARFCLSGFRGSWPEIDPTSAAHDYTHIDDVIDALIIVARAGKKNSTYNVGSGKATTVKELIAELAPLVGLEPFAIESHLPAKNPWIANAARISEELGWKPKIELREGLRETAEWFHDNRHLYLR